MERIAQEAAAEPLKAVAYMRTSSATNVGADKDSEKRQRAAIEAYAKRAGMEVLDWFYDPAVSGADPIETRPGFSALLDRIEGNGVRVVLIEDATRFARDLIAQELGIVVLVSRGVRIITANGDDLTDTSDPSRVMMRQIAGAFAQYEKARLVARLRRAREVKGKLGGRKSLAETRPEVVELARRLRHTRSGKQRSLREISAELAQRGFVAKKTGRPFEAAQVSRMLAEEGEQKQGEARMLTFDDRFHSDRELGCFLWVDETVMGRVRFYIGPKILEDVLHGGNPVHDAANVALCEMKRSRIEAACLRAFANRPSVRIDLQPADFS
jgi:DNA invertase Pin-like site-specific DNA recombinase